MNYALLLLSIIQSAIMAFGCITVLKKYMTTTGAKLGVIAINMFAPLFYVAIPLVESYCVFSIFQTIGTAIIFFELKTKLAESRLQLENSQDSLSAKLAEQKEIITSRTAELEKSNEERTNTFIKLAHETKTPLTLIINYLNDYIDKHGSNEEIKIIQIYVNKLSSYIINFFDIERLSKGYGVYDHSCICNISDLVQTSLPLFQATASKKGIALKTYIEDNLYVKGHPNALERITNNLIENAIKYTPTGGTINFNLQAFENQLIISVKDDGIGINPTLHKRIFDPYFQILSKRNSDGMGMGLPIVKKIVDDLAGKIHLVSEEDKGTNISVSLHRYIPLKKELIKEFISIQNDSLFSLLSTPQIKDLVKDSKRPSILVVEDNVNMLLFIAQKLKVFYNVYCAVNGREGLTKLKEAHSIDLIISDIMMDEMDGYEFYQQVSTHPYYAHTPFIFLSSKTNLEDKLKGLEMGAIDYIDKPFDIKHLITKVTSLLDNISKQREAMVTLAYKSVLNIKQTKKEINLPSLCEEFNLTDREVEILKLMFDGSTAKEISEKLFIAKSTVDKHIQHIYEKATVSNKSELFAKFKILAE